MSTKTLRIPTTDGKVDAFPNRYYRAPMIEPPAHMSDPGAFTPSALRRHWDRLLPLLGHTLAKS